MKYKPTIEAVAAWDEAMSSGKMAELKRNSPTAYASMYKERFGNLPKGAEQKSTNQPVTTIRHQPITSIQAEMSWDALMRSGKMAELKESSPTAYATMFKERFGHLPKGAEQIIAANRSAIMSQRVNADLPKELFMPWVVLAQGRTLSNLKAKDYTAYAVIYNKHHGHPPSGHEGLIDGEKLMVYAMALQEGNQEKKGKIPYDNLPPEIFVPYADLASDGRLKDMMETNYELYLAKYEEEFGALPSYDKNTANASVLSLYRSVLKQFLVEKADKMTFADLQKHKLDKKYEEMNPEGYAAKFKEHFGVLPYETQFK
ncbi:hypothetical protein CJD36_008215 [Flavipsychrobacter stenotrophus]|uniref:Uncharacterized protein n=1 Tax=Flavipsychrobacter stenotrophus TaxID=2077091 RepID=A0A2S7SXY1_9BACT|nr:hypothetical protein [Flavipsychrobacter stenotrophus]PQJ11769.1 hypothetical protein CJD36_008215 [Flavipsychrobacter stenotrophus]